jgi:hypothetical protein
VIIGIVILFDSGFATDDGWDSDNGKKQYKYYSGINKLLAIFVTIILLHEIYIHFGTQFIWLSAISLFCFYLFFLANEDVSYFLNSKRGGKYKDLQFLILLPFVVAVISTIYQFWFTELFWVLNLWQLLATIISVGVIILVIFLIRKRSKMLLQLKLENEEKLKFNQEKKEKEAKAEKTKHEKDEFEKKKMQDAVIRILNDGWDNDWQDMLIVSRYYENNIKQFPDLLSKIFPANIIYLVQISKIKKQIIFGRDFRDALILIEEVAKKSYSDIVLQNLISQTKVFLSSIEYCSPFAGYNELILEVKKHLPTIWDLITEESQN